MTDGATTTDAAASQAADTTAQPTGTAGAQDGTAAATQQPGATPAADAGKTDDAAAKPTGAPEKYEAFKLADGALSAEELAEVEKTARELDLSQDRAQKLAEQRVADKQAAQAATTAALTKARNGWVSDLKADPDIGGDKLAENLALANKALKAHDPDGKLSALLDQTGMGDHPEVVRFFHRLGKSISEDRFVPAGGSTPQGPKDAASVLYPKQAQ